MVPECSLRGMAIALRDGRCRGQGVHLVKASQAHLEHPVRVAQERPTYCRRVCGGGVGRKRVQPRAHAAHSEPLIRARSGDGKQVHVGLVRIRVRVRFGLGRPILTLTLTRLNPSLTLTRNSGCGGRALSEKHDTANAVGRCMPLPPLPKPERRLPRWDAYCSGMLGLGLGLGLGL